MTEGSNRPCSIKAHTARPTVRSRMDRSRTDAS
jgi:hypothetical protein